MRELISSVWLEMCVPLIPMWNVYLFVCSLSGSPLFYSLYSFTNTKSVDQRNWVYISCIHLKLLVHIYKTYVCIHIRICCATVFNLISINQVE